MDPTLPLSVGDLVPDFTVDAFLPAKSEFGRLTCSELLKNDTWLILFFYPADFTFVCPTELADAQCYYPTLRKQGIELMSVSTDTHFTHFAWKNSEKLLSDVMYPMAADPTHALAKLFGVYDAATGLSLRGTFIIDPDGRLCASEVNYYNVGRNCAELARKMHAFQYVRKNPEQVCPALWAPGKKTLTPGKNLVGNVADSMK